MVHFWRVSSGGAVLVAQFKWRWLYAMSAQRVREERAASARLVRSVGPCWQRTLQSLLPQPSEQFEQALRSTRTCR
jgi:hypothetical protein